MVIYEIQGDEIGVNGTGALYCETMAEAKKEIREYKEHCKDIGKTASIIGVTKKTIRNRAELCSALNAATGFGVN